MNKQEPNNNPQGQQPQNTPNPMPFNTMMANQSMYPGMSEGFVYPGANSFQTGYMPYFWYYNPTNQTTGTEPNQSVSQPQAQNIPQNGGMPFIPYPMPYYINPIMYQQGDVSKDDSAGKARKNNFYSTPTGYPGINQPVIILF